jgi:twitching motility protein PilT|tara:strand:+ start:807 stop:1820 length:1014 start_codon:yes stop_codon:yes gene_type:complete
VIEVIARYIEEYKFSDIHLKENQPVMLRVNGDMIIPEEDIISSSELRQFANDSLSEKQLSHLTEVRDVDLAIEVGEYRFRVNFFYTSDGLSAVLRKIETDIPAMAAINLPYVIQEIVDKPNGLVLITGPTGSGKSTTLASIIDAINSTKPGHILTIEDPIEYIHHPKECAISQREVGRDAKSFASALKASLREDPDVILVGELRDLETVQLAITAAETGHLVFGTLHTSGAPNTLNRLIDVFPAAQQGQVRSQLAESLRLVVTQQLVKTADGQGRVAAFEIMVCNHAVRNLVREGKIFQIAGVMQTARGEGMVTMNHSVDELVSSGKINYEDVELKD